MARPINGRADYYKPGDWNAVCSMCGAKRKASQLVLNWQGQYRCPEHNEPRQPQDFVRAVPDVQSVPWAQIPIDVFIDVANLIVIESWNDTNSVDFFAIAIATEAGLPLLTE